jgi:dTDP-4-dehydrorhamnose 3,5-epimerase
MSAGFAITRTVSTARTNGMFQAGVIHDVIIRELKRYVDGRGWLMELYRMDEIDEKFMPAMSYISVTNVGVARGPHEHADQSDVFAFIGPSNFKIYLWDTRKGSPTFGHKFDFLAGADAPKMVIIPAGIVHGYRNVGEVPGVVLNMPNRLYAGKNRMSAVDEIRHEEKAETVFTLG